MGARCSKCDPPGKRDPEEEEGAVEAQPIIEQFQGLTQKPDIEWQLGWDLLEEPLREEWVKLVRATWLVDLAESGGVLRRRQDLPEEAFIGVDELKAAGPGKYVLGTCVRVIVLSYPWLQPSHPDPHGENLRVIAKVLKLYVQHQQNEGKPYGVLIDYTALPQVPRGQEDQEEEDIFNLAMPALSLFYSHPQTVVFKLTAFPQGYPNDSAPQYDLPKGSNTAAYADRGWCFAESAVTGLVKSPDKVLDLGHFNHDDGLLEAIMASRVRRTPPLHPDDFNAELEKKTFASKAADFGTVAKLYSDAFKLHLESAKELDYSGLMWDPEAVRQLLQALRDNCALRSLNLGDNHVGLEGSVALGEALRNNTSLILLELPNTNIGPKGVAALGEALQSNRSLQILNLYKNKVGSEGAASLGEALQSNSSLQELNLRRNRIGKEGAVALGEALRSNTSLQTLQLYGNNVGPQGAAALAEALRSNVSLQCLRLGENEIGAEGAAAFGEALRGNASLLRLDLRGNDIGSEAAIKLQEALRSNDTLQEVDLRDNNICLEADNTQARFLF